MVPRREIVAPHAAILIESMRDIGYSLQTAISDLIDNSITAGATSIELLADTTSNSPAIGILDDGFGMSEHELLEAMRPGARSPLERRPDSDLGRFGLGLKTASFSQCRRLTVVTQKDCKVSCAIWDLDIVAETNQWCVELPERTSDIPWSDCLERNGTLVVWQKLDRLVDPKNIADRQSFVRKLDEMAYHLELVFHRFLSGERGLKKISISLNGRKLKPFDPFHSRHSATIRKAKEVFKLEGQKIVIEPYTLPHHNKVTTDEWNRYAGPEGYIKNQGFYLYREKRLIIHGTWFNLTRQTELTKLARVRIDMPNGMDALWKIDVKKASAQLPAPVRARLRRIIETLVADSKRTYRVRGTKQVSDDRLPVWTRSQDKNLIIYGLNRNHPSFMKFTDNLGKDCVSEFDRLLSLIESTIPIDALFSDVSSNEKNVRATILDDEAFANLVRDAFQILKSGNYTKKDIRLMMKSAEPFRSNWSDAEKIISSIEIELSDD